MTKCLENNIGLLIGTPYAYIKKNLKNLKTSPGVIRDRNGGSIYMCTRKCIVDVSIIASLVCSIEGKIK